jgi:hypothetical protein
MIHSILNWLYHFWGVGGSGPYYGFWSGTGSDIGEVAIVGGIAQLVRHHNCHAKGCWRLGRPLEGTPYLACHHHHPFHKGNKRNVAVEVLINAGAKPVQSPATPLPAPPDQS